MVYLDAFTILELTEWDIRTLKNQKKYPVHLHCYCKNVLVAVDRDTTLFKCCDCDDTIWTTHTEHRREHVERRLR